MNEIAPGIRHWTARHPKIGTDVSSYWLPDQRVVLDPITVPDEIGDVDEILLTNRHHLRASLEARDRLRGRDPRAAYGDARVHRR